MRKYEDMTPEQVEEFHVRHNLVLDIDFKGQGYRVLYEGTVIREGFHSMLEAIDFANKEENAHRAIVQEMLERVGDLCDDE